ncbi:HNH endonuclease signature motif containing protein [Amycolatopsis sp. CA-230715]|uniref:HNH endonuclease signature motif containing protein n=1 Tax=Amycolatopsis sp. CA-230715 TaxID=2745196 RepID=UPI001C01CCBE|nr:HNH endonuclease signature motif containing protein [Amycolatopsis sp. CA-230715]
MDVLEKSEEQVVADSAEHWKRWYRYGQAMLLRHIVQMSQVRSRRSVLAWVALSCNCTQAGAERKAALADALTSYLPRTLEALENGLIDEGMAAKVFEATACASQDVAREVDARVKFENKNSASLRRMVNTLLMRIDPEGYEARRRAKTAARMLEIRHGDHGSSTLFAELPSDRAQAIYAACDRDALEEKRQGDKRTMDQLRVDALVERCLGGECGGKPKAQIYVYIDLPTLMGMRNNPGELAGCGEISPEMAREIAFDTNSVWNRIVSEPMTGLPIDMGRKSYRPSKKMRKYIQVLHRTCCMIGCHRPAQYSDLDHAQPWSEGGGTDKVNIRPFCRVHHGLRDEPGWEFHTDANGVTTVTTPDGRTYTDDPEGFI